MKRYGQHWKNSVFFSPDDVEASIEASNSGIIAAILQPTEEKKPEQPRGQGGKFTAKQPDTVEAVDDVLEDTVGAGSGSDTPSDVDENPDAQPEDTTNAGVDDEISDEEIEALEFDVVVNGEAQKVTLKDLKKNYSGSKYIEANIQQTVEARKKSEEIVARYVNDGNMLIAKLEQVDNILKSFAEPNINWEELKAKDPMAYILRREEQEDARRKQAALAEEIKRIKEDADKKRQDTLERWKLDEAKTLMAKVPELSNPKTAKALMDKFVKAGERYGYTLQEFMEVVDHRPMLILNDALKYHELMEAHQKTEPAQETANKKAMLRPGAKKPLATLAQRQRAEAEKRARTSGRPEDVAMTLIK